MHKSAHGWSKQAGTAVLLGLAIVLAAACGSNTSAPTTTAAPAAQSGFAITLGDIDPDEPSKKIARFTPLARYLAENLREFGVSEGRVMVARDIDEMARWMRDGTVDIYFDSAFPTLAVQQQSGSEIILRRWKDGVVERSGSGNLNRGISGIAA